MFARYQATRPLKIEKDEKKKNSPTAWDGEYGKHESRGLESYGKEQDQEGKSDQDMNRRHGKGMANEWERNGKGRSFHRAFLMPAC